MNVNTSTEAANEDGINTTKDEKISVKTRLYREYAVYIVGNKNIADSNKNLEKLLSISGSLPDTEMAKLSKFMRNSSVFEDVDEKDIQLGSLQRELRHEFTRRSYVFKKTKDHVLKEYNMTPKEYEKSGIEAELKTINIPDVSKLTNSKSALKSFIKEYYRKGNTKIPETRSNNVLSAKFSDLPNRIKKKINSLAGDEKANFIREVEYFGSHASLSSQEYPRNFATYLDTLLQEGIFSQAEKSEIIQTFIPFISAKEASQINPSLNIDSIITKELEKIESLQFAQLNKETKQEIISQTNKEDFLIPVELLELGNADVTAQLLNQKQLAGIGKYYSDVAKDIAGEGGPQGLKEFQDILKTTGKVEGSQLFQTGSIIEFDILDKKGANEREKGTEKKVFFQILQDGSKDGHLVLANRGIGEYESKPNAENTHYAYNDLLKFLKEGKNAGEVVVQNLKVFTQDSLETKIAKGEIIENQESIEFKSQNDLDARKERKKNELIQEAIQKKDLDTYASDEETEKYLEDNNLLEDLDLEADNYNLSYLQANIDKIDEKGKEFKLGIGTVVDFGYKSATNSKTIDIFHIVSTNSEGLGIEHINGKKQELSYQEFFDSFKESSAQRVSNIQTSEDFVDALIREQSIGEKWAGMSIKDGHLVKKSLSENGDEYAQLDFIIGESSFLGDHNLIKINKIDGNYADIFTGKSDFESSNTSKEEKADMKEGKKPKKYSISSNSQRISLAALAEMVKKSGGEPSNMGKAKEEENPDEVERKTNLLSRWFQMASLFDIIAGGKLIIDSIESKLKEGSEEIAARLALRAGKMIPGMDVDMRMRVEQAQRKRVDDFKERLNGIDSGVATELISVTLLNKDAPESEKEACLLFMAEKYGTLYEKKALFPYSGKYLWYTAFGGTIGDKIFMDVKADAEKEGINFSEHDLMIRLLGQQCKEKAKPYRRSKLHKEYKAMMAKGKKDEKQKGADDAGEKRTVDGRLYQVALGELEDGAYANAMGALKAIIGKGDGGDLKKLTMLPFVMNMSGVAYEYDQDMVNAFFGEVGENGHPIMGTFFTSKPALIKTHNETVVEIARTLSEKEGGKYKNMYKDAQRLYGYSTQNGLDPSSEEDPTRPVNKVKNAVAFYEEYGDELNRIMNMLNTRQTDTISNYEKLIWEKRNDSSSVFKDYYAGFNGFAGDMMDYSKDDDTLADAFSSSGGPGTGGITGMAARKVFYDTLKSQSGGNGYRMKLSGPMIENEFIEQLKTWKNHPTLTDEKKKLYMEDYIASYLYAMLENLQASGGKSSMRESYRGIKFLNAYAGDFDGLFGIDFKDESLTNPKAKSIVEKYTQNVLQGGGNINTDSFNFDSTMDMTRNAANDTLNGSEK